MRQGGSLPGLARSLLPQNVAYLDPAPAMFTAMLDGWETQQRARFLKKETISARTTLVRRFVEFSNLYPWQWTPAEAEAFFDHMRSGSRPIVVSTARGYQTSLRLFMEYVTDSRYSWPIVCQERFGEAPTQIFHEANSIAHVTEFEGQPHRRPLTYDEVQALFDAADARVGKISESGRKGALAAFRDAALLKTIYAFGLRRSEAWGLDLTDLRRSPKAAEFGQFGALFVRHGKSSNGSPPKRRTVLAIPEMDWVIPVLSQWLEDGRPGLSPGAHPAMWVTERCSRLSRRRINMAFETAREAAGLAPELDLHCLRHSYVTHLVEFDYPPKFVRDQVGHEYESTTAIYTGVSDEYRNQVLQRSLVKRNGDLWEERA